MAVLVEPAHEAVGAEVLLDDEPRLPVGRQPPEPAHEQLVERGLADADRRVRPDAVEADVRRAPRRELRPSRCPRPAAAGVVTAELPGPLVHVDRPDPSRGRPPCEGEGDRPVPASEVERARSSRWWSSQPATGPRAGAASCRGRSVRPRTRPGRWSARTRCRAGRVGRGGGWTRPQGPDRSSDHRHRPWKGRSPGER